MLQPIDIGYSGSVVQVFKMLIKYNLEMLEDVFYPSQFLGIL
jgi:hypothetical protein